MGIDVQLSGDFHGTLRSWVKCARCSERLNRPYPVEAMGLEGVEDVGTTHRRYKVVVAVECHGEKMRVAMAVPTYWGSNGWAQALAYVYAFVKKGPLYTAEVRRGTRGQDPGFLRTEVG